MGIFLSTIDLLWFGNESPRRCKGFSRGGRGRSAVRGKQRQSAARAGVAFPGPLPPGSAPFPGSHLQGQDAVVPHKRLAVTSFRSLSGFPATIKGHVCRREEGGGGKWRGRRGARCGEAVGWKDWLSLQFTRCSRAPRDWDKRGKKGEREREKAAMAPRHSSG